MPERMLRLFFALRPPPESVRRIAEAVAALKAASRVRWLKPAKYHLTAQFLGNHAGEIPPGLLGSARRAGDAVRMPPFEIALERLDCFGTRAPAPLILRPDAPSEAALQDFHGRLDAALLENGQQYRDEHDFTPHLTVGYGAPLQPLPIAPLAWLATEFELIVSHAGEARYESIGRWPLRV